MKKGSKLYIEGQLRTRKWQGQDGKDNYTTEVVLEGFNSNLTMLDSQGQGEGGNSSGNTSGGDTGFGGGSDAGWGNGQTSAPDLDDEIPF